ncbi:outer membrane lipoprotein-sorting protein [Verrucomicrobiaceae bacterium R5-34]|nr:outer membrane lipoprotein-sorting protein [Verrucomicrobiaceae bacterium R5-34]
MTIRPSFRPMIAAAFAVATCLVSNVRADEAADRILEGVRLSATLQQNNLTGNLRKNGKRSPIALFLRGENIQFQYFDGKVWQKFHMRLKKDKFDLFELKNGKTLRFPSSKLSQPIMGTDLTYEDLAFRFLYWPNATIEGSEKIKTQDCYKIRLVNPTRDGSYGIVYIWVHKKYGALMQVSGYNRDGQLLKRFHVTNLMKVGDVQTLEKMNVETYKLGTQKVTGITYMEFEKPKEVKKGLR